MKAKLTAKEMITQHRTALTNVSILLLIITLVVVFFGSPDFSETASEWLLSLIPSPDIQINRDISYTVPPDASRTGDLYSSATGTGARPAVVIVHGGNWARGSKRDFDQVSIAKYFASHGYVAFCIDYRSLLNKGRFPDDIIDVKEALCYLATKCKKLEINPRRIFVIGTASGASAAMLCAYTTNTGEFTPASGESWPVTAVASISGPVDFTQLSHSPHLREWLNSKGEEQYEDMLPIASPISYVTTAVPTILVHGTQDQNVPITQVLSFARRLREHKVPVWLAPIDGQKYGISASARQKALDSIQKFFSRAP